MKAIMFPGQGSQARGMGEELFNAFPELTQTVDDILGYSIVDLCVNSKDGRLNQTQFTQPALYTVNALSYLKMQQEGETAPDFFLGHSLGEYNALHASGALSFEDGLKLVAKRGELMSQAPKGAMAAILKVDIDEVKRLLAENDLECIDVANYNSPSQTVISGLEEDIQRAEKAFENAGLFVPLNTSGAFHSRYMEQSRKAFKDFLSGFSFADFNVPVIANIYAQPYQQDAIVDTLADQITHSIYWTDSVAYLAQQGVTEFKEAGPGDVLTKLVTFIQQHIEKHGSESLICAPSQAAIATPNEAEATSQPVAASVEQPSSLQSDSESQTLINQWNQQHPVGTKVSVKGYQDPIKTRTEAMMLFGHKAVIYLQGYKGYFDLQDVSLA